MDGGMWLSVLNLWGVGWLEAEEEEGDWSRIMGSVSARHSGLLVPGRGGLRVGGRPRGRRPRRG